MNSSIFHAAAKSIPRLFHARLHIIQASYIRMIMLLKPQVGILKLCGDGSLFSRTAASGLSTLRLGDLRLCHMHIRLDFDHTYPKGAGG
jgi:hypothetical protein